MDQDICIHCKRKFKKYRKHQEYCSDKACQRARKAKWQRDALKTNPEYREHQKQENIDWQKNNPGYWRRYFEKNPDKALRNRMLQRIRNQKKRYQTSESTALRAMFNRIETQDFLRLIAKMDVSKISQSHTSSDFWIIPVIAKMDALKVNITIKSAR
jgi:hypothetical protein